MMLFENPTIDIDSLPQVEMVEMSHPHRNYLKVIQLSTLFFMSLLLIGIIVAYFITEELPFPYFFHLLFGTWFILLLYFIWLGWRGFHNQAYTLREKDIIYKKGVFVQSLMTIPFNRVQHCEITQGPIERFFKLKTLEIFTAGGHTSDLEIPGLSGKKAQILKDYIIKTTTNDGSSEEE